MLRLLDMGRRRWAVVLSSALLGAAVADLFGTWLSPSYPAARPLVVPLGAATGLALALAVFVRLEVPGGLVRHPQELVAATRLPFLGEVQALAGPLQGAGGGLPEGFPGSEAASAYRALSLRIQRWHGQVRSLVVVGGRAEQSGELAALLSLILAESGRRVVLVDGDVVDNVVTRLFGLEQHTGLAEALASEALASDPAGEPTKRRRGPSVTLVGNLPVLPRGRSRPAAVGPEGVARLLATLLDQADLVVVAAAPPARSPSALAWAAGADATVLVATAGETTQTDVAGAAEHLVTNGANLVGTVLYDRRGVPESISHPRP